MKRKSAFAQPKRLDPTRTGLIRKRFEAEIRRRVTALKKEMFQLLTGDVDLDQVTANKEFRFDSAADAYQRFQRWMQSRSDQIVIERIPQQRQGEPKPNWTQEYIETAYFKGSIQAEEAVNRGRGIIPSALESRVSMFLKAPVNLDKVRLISGRAYEQLGGFTTEMSTKTATILADGITRGDSPRTTARIMAKEIDSLTKKRALTIARTETIRAHAEGSLDAMEQMGVEEVGVNVEFQATFIDEEAGIFEENVCPKCQKLAGLVLPIAKAHGMIPVHPNCRCAWVPSLDEPEGKEELKETVKEAQEIIKEEPASEPQPKPAAKKKEPKKPALPTPNSDVLAMSNPYKYKEVSIDEERQRHLPALKKFRESLAKKKAAAEARFDKAFKEKWELVAKEDELRVKFNAIADDILVIQRTGTTDTDPDYWRLNKEYVELEGELAKMDKEYKKADAKVEKERQRMREWFEDAIADEAAAVNKQDGLQVTARENAAAIRKAFKGETMVEKSPLSEGAYAKEVRKEGGRYMQSVANPVYFKDALTQPLTVYDNTDERASARALTYDGREKALHVKIELHPNTPASTYIHEMAHHIEATNPETARLCLDFLEKRRGNEKPTKFRDVLPRLSYGPDEKGILDDFLRVYEAMGLEGEAAVNKALYSGKIYDDRSNRTGIYAGLLEATEVFTMGIELLYLNPEKFAEADPEWFDLVTGILSGRLLTTSRFIKRNPQHFSWQ